MRVVEESWAELVEILAKRSLCWVDWFAAVRRERPSAVLGEATRLLCWHGRHVGYPQISEDDRIQAAYVAQRLDGSTHTFAEMMCLASPPMSNSDREFLEGRGGCYDQFGSQPWVGDAYLAEAKRQGVDTTGKVYLNGLARYPGDPEAWISDRGDVKRRLEERGWGSQGAVNVKAREPDCAPAPDIDVAEDIVDSAVAGRIEENPELARMDQGELRHETKELIKPHWA